MPTTKLNEKKGEKRKILKINFLLFNKIKITDSKNWADFFSYIYVSIRKQIPTEKSEAFHASRLFLKYCGYFSIHN